MYELSLSFKILGFKWGDRIKNYTLCVKCWHFSPFKRKDQGKHRQQSPNLKSNLSSQVFSSKQHIAFHMCFVKSWNKTCYGCRTINSSYKRLSVCYILGLHYHQRGEKNKLCTHRDPRRHTNAHSRRHPIIFAHNKWEIVKLVLGLGSIWLEYKKWWNTALLTIPHRPSTQSQM